MQVKKVSREELTKRYPGRDKIEEIERAMMAMPEHQVKIDVFHYFAKGLYAREVFIPAGTTATGKIHRTEHLNILAQGEIEVLTDHGMERLTAPCVLVSQPGTKRVGYAVTDTVWITVHASEEQDLAKLEAELISPSYEGLELVTHKNLLEGA